MSNVIVVNVIMPSARGTALLALPKLAYSKTITLQPQSLRS